MYSDQRTEQRSLRVPDFSDRLQLSCGCIALKGRLMKLLLYYMSERLLTSRQRAGYQTLPEESEEGQKVRLIMLENLE